MTGGRGTLWLHPRAATEVAKAVRHYDALAPRLGQIVLSELRSVARRILACPTACPEVLPSVRVTSVAHLPQWLFYTLNDDDAVVVLALVASTDQADGPNGASEPCATAACPSGAAGPMGRRLSPDVARRRTPPNEAEPSNHTAEPNIYDFLTISCQGGVSGMAVRPRRSHTTQRGIP